MGDVFAVAISPDGSTIAVGGWTEKRHGNHPIYLFDRESGNLIRRIADGLPDVTDFLTFSAAGRYLAAVLNDGFGLRVFDRDKDWREVFRDDQYGDSSYGAAFARDGSLATTAVDGMIRLYEYDPSSGHPNFRRVGEPAKVASGQRPYGVAFSPDGKRLAVGYENVAAVDILDGTTLERMGGHSPANMTHSSDGLGTVAWSLDGQTLFAAGGVRDAQKHGLLFAWDRGGLGGERRMTYCAPDTAAGVNALPEGQILVAAMAPCLGLMDGRGEPIWTISSPILDFRGQTDEMRVSQDGNVVDFSYRESAGTVLRFDVRSLTLSSPPPNDGLTFAPNREGLTIVGWRNGANPTLNGQALPLHPHEIARSLAIAPDAKLFFLGSSYALIAFDTGAPKWRWPS